METTNNKRIAKNTIFLYFRMVILMLISLYTSRVTLLTLGVEDFGIYNVVGGVVSMFSLLSGAMSNAISRYLTFELGRGIKDKLSKVFSTALNVQLLLGLAIAVLIELIGVYFLNVKMNIPPERLYAANCVLQISIISFVVNLISIPYNSAIIAHEKMSAFAYISIYEAIMKLVVVYCIVISSFDKLITYSILLLLVSISLRLIYGVYCKRNFEECHYVFVIDRPLLKQMTSFAGWNFLGSGSWLLMTQGVNMLLNLFFGVTLNAARGVANQVENVVTQFSNNFGTAINPQITKNYALGNLKYMHDLVFLGSKYSFFLLTVLCLPLIFEAQQILHLWLGVVPDYAPMFLRLTLCISMLSVVSNTLVTSMMATGDIKKYQIIVGGLGMTIFPIVYILYKLHMPPECSYYVHFIIFVSQLVARLYLLKEMINLPIRRFVREVLIRDICILVIPITVSSFLIFRFDETIYRLMALLVFSELGIFMSIYLFGMSSSERVKFHSVLNHKINDLKKNSK